MRTRALLSILATGLVAATACRPVQPPAPPPADRGPAVITLQRRGQVNRIELTTPTGQTSLLRSKYISAAEPSPDGNRLAVVQTSGASSELTVHPLRDGRLGDPTMTYRASIGAIRWSDDGTRIATAGAEGTTWAGIDVVDVATGQLVRQIPPTYALNPDFGCSIGTGIRLHPADWHPAGTHLLAYASVAGCEVVFVDLVEIDLATGQLLELADLGVETVAASYSPDGNSVMAQGDNGVTSIIDRRTGNRTTVATRVMPAWGARGQAALVEWGANGAIDVEVGNPLASPWAPTLGIPAPRANQPEWSSDGTGLLVWSELGIVLHPIGVDGHPVTVDVPGHADVLAMAVVRGFS